MAFFEWSADPDADPLDPSTLDFHPALDITQPREALLAERPPANSLANYRRGFLNLRVESVDRTIIDQDAWEALADPALALDVTPEVFGIAVAREHSGASIWAAWRTSTGRTALAMVSSAAGTGWITDAASALARLHPAAVWVANDSGATRTAADDLRSLGIEVHGLRTIEYAAASAWLTGRVRAEGIAHDGDPGVWEAIEHAVLAPMAGGQAPDARRSTGPIDCLVAAMTAGWWADTRLTDPVQIW